MHSLDKYNPKVAFDKFRLRINLNQGEEHLVSLTDNENFLFSELKLFLA